ncbi:MAG TPA: Spy/CpxP family protein refolding chaperone, partial [Thermoanaerobaculia bacterium]|nr:Spy/CpxP family protein refolding chaperone [Thermoanaerobaculia bacterium]
TPTNPPGRPAAKAAEYRPLFAALANFLELTDAQRTAARQIFDQARETARPLIEQLRTQRQAVRDLLDDDNPAASEVGDAVIAAKTTAEQLRGIREGAVTNFRTLLTPAQQAKLDVFQAVVQAIRRAHGRGPAPDAGAEEDELQAP